MMVADTCVAAARTFAAARAWQAADAIIALNSEGGRTIGVKVHLCLTSAHAHWQDRSKR
jgi:hypothetical protein